MQCRDHVSGPGISCPGVQCRDHVSGPSTLRAGYTSCSTRGTLEANSWINSCIVASYLCSAQIIDICIGVMLWVDSWLVKSRPFSSISSRGLTLSTASASATSLPGMYLISKSYGCVVSNTLLDWVVHFVKKFFFQVNFSRD